MNLIFTHHGTQYRSNQDQPRSIAIELDFCGDQPSHFGAERARRSALHLGDFVGRTEQGSGCNVDVLTMIPHCNGTHTETIGHIVSDQVGVGRAALSPVVLAALVTVTPAIAGNSADTYRPVIDANDVVIDAAQLESVVAELMQSRPEALIVRTMPNPTTKRSREYAASESPPFFTIEAMEVIDRLGVTHLLVDVPSVDRMRDDGLLTNHHLFWNLPEGTHAITDGCHLHRTITEMVFVDDDLTDGLYGLSLQIPAFCSDAAPSRPIIWGVDAMEKQG